MKDKIIRLILVVIMVVTLLITSTASFAKYIASNESTLRVSTDKEIWYKTYSDSSNGYFDFETTYDGYYAIIVKGGNGGNGNKGEGSNWACRKDTEGQTGGYGGVMYGIFSSSDIGYLKIYLGSCGQDSTTNKTTVSGGINSSNPSFSQGASGNNSETSLNWNSSSGGSGAGSIVYAYATRTSAGKHLGIIAGGGGGSAGNDLYYDISVTGFGGTGGSNYSTDKYTSNISATVVSQNMGNVYSGFDGTSPDGKKSYGYGGGTSGGSGGSVGRLNDLNGNSGTNYTGTSGSGNGATVKKTCAGPGGGGYAGGGSGGLISYPSIFNSKSEFNPGGGGGGSSYIYDKMSIKNYKNNSLLTNIFDYMHDTSNYSPNKNSDGYVIVMYLGRNTDANTELLTRVPLIDKTDSYYGKYVSDNVTTVTAKQTGYYIVVAKGGNGGDGYKYNGGIKYYIPGGVGGITYSYVHATAGEQFSVYLGSKGGTPTPGSGRTYGGAAGTNGLGRGLGAVGSYHTGNYSSLTENMASGGGGAATIVCYNGTTLSNIVSIAGGGGGAGSWDEGMSFGATMRESGGGGAGGTNAPGNILEQKKYDKSSSDWFGRIIYGSDGLTGSTPDPKNAIGKGASSMYGTGGTSSKNNYTASETASNGCSPSDSNYPGFGGKGVQHGGSGGGGFAGGGGGAGTSIDYSAGGGGGGSSFIKVKDESGIPTNTQYYNMLLDMFGFTGNETDGFYIIAYVGTEAP